MFTNVTHYRLPNKEYMNRRLSLSSKIDQNTAVILFAGRAPMSSLDDAYPFLPNRNFFYFCGIEQEESALILIKHSESSMRSGQPTFFEERLYILPREPEKEKWTGHRLSCEEAAAISGITDVRSLTGLSDDIEELLENSLQIAWDETDHSPIHARFEQILAKSDQFDSAIDISGFASLLRIVKSDAEVKAIQAAIRVTEESLEVMEQALHPGMTENEARAILECEMMKRGSLFHAFPTISAGGSNTLCLHYPTPTEVIEDGQMLQIDCGARACGYCADISRAYAVNRKRDARQQALFELIIECKQAALDAIHPGSTIAQVNDATRKVAAAGLRDLGVIAHSAKDALAESKKYYWHNTLHFLGLDVHDVGDREMVFVPGMVFAVEPGIYIPEWGFGFRVEDDVLVTTSGSTYLSTPQS